jgi:hypothetical protein
MGGMRRLTTSAFLICLAMTMLGTDAFGLEPQRGRCQEDWCTWTRIITRKLIKSEKDASLYEVETISGTTSHKDWKKTNDGMYPETLRKWMKVDWSKEPEKVYVFCYDKLPVYFADEAYVLYLDFSDPPAAEANAASVYIPVCYGVTVREFGEKSFRQKHKIGDPIMDQVSAKDPLELFKYVK